MGVGAFLEPAIVLGLLLGGTWINRNKGVEELDDEYEKYVHERGVVSPSVLESSPLVPDSESEIHSAPPSPIRHLYTEGKWRKREIGFLGFSRSVRSLNTRPFKNRILSRLLARYPFLVEVWYWALIYWVYQLGRAFSAVTIVEGTVHVARHHALQLIHFEERLHIAWELGIQATFLRHPTLMLWTTRIYSFIHIPGTILFLVWLYFYTVTQNRTGMGNRETGQGSPAGPLLYEARRRTMALCNILAFIVFTAWPCMPPRLLSNPSSQGKDVEEASKYPFVDTVHAKDGEASVWTENRFVNHYAAMPSLHFGYSLLVGLTIATIPLASRHRASQARLIPFLGRISCPSLQRMMCVAVGFSYSFAILTAIVATANHFILDAVAGAMICGIAWRSNTILLNLVPLEDMFLWCLRIHKPERSVVEKGVLQEDL